MLSADSTPADVIRVAVEYIDEHGWTQGEARRSDGSACMVGGVASTFAGAGDVAWLGSGVTACAVLSRYFIEETDTQGGVIAFNDMPGREWDECRKHMLLAAESWERGELR